MSTTRDQIIETTCQLIERQGYHATGLNEIVKESGAPKGSLYYYFPEGKEEIAAQAICRSGQAIAGHIRQNLAGGEAAEAVEQFVRRIADSVEASGFKSGGPLQTVALETAASSERLNLACRAAYTLLQGAFQEKLQESGYPELNAARMASFITSAIEGGILLSRTYHSGDPLRLVAEQLRRAIELDRPPAGH